MSGYRWSTILKNPLHYIHKYPHRTKQILGITYDQFLLLVKQAEVKHKKQQALSEEKKVCINAIRGERKPKLTLAEEMYLSLFYLKQMPTFEV